MKILIFNGYYVPEKAASIYLEEDIAKGFCDNGFDVKMFVPTPCRGLTKEQIKEYRKKENREEILLDGKLHVVRFKLYKEPKRTIFRTIRYFIQNRKQYKLGIKEKDVDIIFCGSTPPTQGYVCAKIAKKLSKKYKKHVPFVYNLQDIFPDSLVNTGLTKKGSLLWKIGRRIENKTYAAADKIIVISEDFKKNIMAKGVPEEKIEVVYNWVDTDNVFKVERKDNVLFDKYNLDRNLFYVAYSGNLGYTQNLDLLLSVAKKIKFEMPDLRFVLIGDGSDKQRIEGVVKDENIDNVIFLPFQDYKDISQVFSIGDVGLIISKKGVGNNSVPSKTYSYMAAERPIIVSFDKDSQLANLITEIGCGVVAEADNEDEFIQAIKSVRANLTIGEYGRKYLLENLSKDECVKKYLKTVEEVVRKDI